MNLMTKKLSHLAIKKTYPEYHIINQTYTEYPDLLLSDFINPCPKFYSDFILYNPKAEHKCDQLILIWVFFTQAIPNSEDPRNEFITIPKSKMVDMLSAYYHFHNLQINKETFTKPKARLLFFIKTPSNIKVSIPLKMKHFISWISGDGPKSFDSNSSEPSDKRDSRNISPGFYRDRLLSNDYSIEEKIVEDDIHFQYPYDLNPPVNFNQFNIQKDIYNSSVEFPTTLKQWSEDSASVADRDLDLYSYIHCDKGSSTKRLSTIIRSKDSRDRIYQLLKGKDSKEWISLVETHTPETKITPIYRKYDLPLGYKCKPLIYP